MNDHATASTALATVAPQAPVDFDTALRRMAAGSARQTPRSEPPAPPTPATAPPPCGSLGSRPRSGDA